MMIPTPTWSHVWMSCLWAVTALWGCAGLETGNGQDPTPPDEGQVTVQLALSTVTPPTTLVDELGNTLTLTEALIVVDEVRLELVKDDALLDCESLAESFPEIDIDCGKSNRLEIASEVTADLIASQWSPALGVFTLPQSMVKNVRVFTQDATIAGALTVEGKTYDVELVLAVGDDVSFSPEKNHEKNLEIAPEQPLSLTLEVDLEGLFLNTDLAACVKEQALVAPNTSPLVLSEGKACSDVLSKATKALKNSASLR